MSKIIPSAENISSDTPEKTVFNYYDKDGIPTHKSAEVYKKKALIILHPYSVDRKTGLVKSKRIKTLEFRGWSTLSTLPMDFRKTPPYGLKTKKIKSIFTLIYPKFRELQKVVFGKEMPNRFNKQSINLNWEGFNDILKKVVKINSSSDSERKATIQNELSKLTPKYTLAERRLTAGELEAFLSRFNSFEKITSKDAESLAKVLEKLPSGKIVTTSHFLQTRQKLDVVYLEDIIDKFKKILLVKNKNEEQWHKFFETYSWILNHVFPYQVILRKSKAYVGGKTIENAEGRIVDFLFENNLGDNFALLEIKTHLTELIETSTAYRKPDVFALSRELSGGINQCLDQKFQFLKDFGKEHPSYDPATILVIGQKSSFDKHQVKCFELVRSNNKNVFIVTFDELLSKLEGLLKVITGKI